MKNCPKCGSPQVEEQSDTPETDAQLTTYTSISKSGKHFTNKKGTVSAEFARKLERERDEARECYKAAMELAARYKSERDKVSVLVRRLFELLDTVELSDSETEFRPTVIRSCRIMHTQELNELLPKLKEASK
jgi:hypothetical protein